MANRRPEEREHMFSKCHCCLATLAFKKIVSLFLPFSRSPVSRPALFFLTGNNDEFAAAERGFADGHAERGEAVAAELARFFFERRGFRRRDQLVEKI